MKKLISFLFVVCLFVPTLVANNVAQDQFVAANKQYEAEEYSRAISSYQELLKQGYQSAELQYNLGNAYYKNHQNAFAILHYEKALKLDPNHEDAVFNLKLANQKTVDKVEAIPELFIYRWWKDIFNLFSLQQWTQLVFFFLVFCLIALTLYFFSRQLKWKKLGFFAAIVFLFLSLSSWAMAAKQNSYLHKITAAIIIQPTVNINSSPSAGSSRLFVLHEGTKVKVVETKNDWANISLPNGNKGWIKSEEIEGI